MLNIGTVYEFYVLKMCGLLFYDKIFNMLLLKNIKKMRVNE